MTVIHPIDRQRVKQGSDSFDGGTGLLNARRQWPSQVRHQGRCRHNHAWRLRTKLRKTAGAIFPR